MVAAINGNTAAWAFHLIFFLYIAMIIGSCGVLVGWVPTTRRIWREHREHFIAADEIEMTLGTASRWTYVVHSIPVLGTCWALRWSRAFQISVAIVENSLFMIAACTFRIVQLMYNGPSIMGLGDFILALLLIGIVDSKRRMNRAGSIRGDRSMRWQWCAFNVLVTASAVAVALLAFFTEIGYIRPA